MHIYIHYIYIHIHTFIYIWNCVSVCIHRDIHTQLIGIDVNEIM